MADGWNPSLNLWLDALDAEDVDVVWAGVSHKFREEHVGWWVDRNELAFGDQGSAVAGQLKNGPQDNEAWREFAQGWIERLKSLTEGMRGAQFASAVQPEPGIVYVDLIENATRSDPSSQRIWMHRDGDTWTVLGFGEVKPELV